MSSRHENQLAHASMHEHHRDHCSFGSLTGHDRVRAMAVVGAKNMNEIAADIQAKIENARNMESRLDDMETKRAKQEIDPWDIKSNDYNKGDHLRLKRQCAEAINQAIEGIKNLTPADRGEVKKILHSYQTLDIGRDFDWYASMKPITDAQLTDKGDAVDPALWIRANQYLTDPRP